MNNEDILKDLRDLKIVIENECKEKGISYFEHLHQIEVKYQNDFKFFTVNDLKKTKSA